MKRNIIIIIISALALLTTASYFFLDDKVYFFLFKYRPNICTNHWINAFRQLGKAWVPIWLLLIWLITTRQVKPVLVAIIAMPLIFPFVYPAKYFIARPRPEFQIAVTAQPEKEHHFDRQLSSFPSGDTATAYAVATALTPYIANSSIAAFRFAALTVLHSSAFIIALLRILASKHYPSDTIAGAAIGILAAYLAWIIIEKHPNLRPHIYTCKTARIITLILIAALPFLAGYERINSLYIFIRQFWPLILIAAAFAWFRYNTGFAKTKYSLKINFLKSS